MKIGVSSVINDNNGKDKRNKEFNCVDIRRQGSLNRKWSDKSRRIFK